MKTVDVTIFENEITNFLYLCKDLKIEYINEWNRCENLVYYTIHLQSEKQFLYLKLENAIVFNIEYSYTQEEILN